MPAFVGLGAPWWDARRARRDLRAHPQYGRRRACAARRSKRSAIRPAICSMRCARIGRRQRRHRVARRRRHGGERCTMQFLADILAAPVDRPAVHGNDRAGRRLSRRPCRRPVSRSRGLSQRCGRCERRFEPRMDAATRERKWRGWRAAVERTLSISRPPRLVPRFRSS